MTADTAPTAQDTAEVARLLREALHAAGVTTPVEDGSHLFPESSKGWVRMGLIDVQSAQLLLELLTRASNPRTEF